MAEEPLPFKVDLTTITTNNSMRNGRVQQALETNQFPSGTFKLTQPITLPANVAGALLINAPADKVWAVVGNFQGIR